MRNIGTFNDSSVVMCLTLGAASLERNQNNCTLFGLVRGRRFLGSRRLECNGFEVWQFWFRYSRLVMYGVDLNTVQELMGHKTIAMTARYAHLAPTHKLRALETLVRPGAVSVQSGYKLATNAKKPCKAKKIDILQLVDSK
jgi:hypothetical protein